MAEVKKRVDESWKQKVAQERAEMTAKAEEAAAEGSQEDEAIFLDFIVNTLAAQVQMSLGMMANPITGQAEVNPEQAKYFIDLIAMLDRKTKPTQTTNEKTFFAKVLPQLQMAFVQATGGAMPSSPAGEAPTKKGKKTLPE